METVFDRFMKQARNGLFGVLLTMAKDGHSHKLWSVFGIFFDFFQLLGYALYGGKYFPWAKMPVMEPFLKFLNVVNVGNAADTVSPLFKLALLFVVLGWIAGTVVAVVYSAYGFSAGDFSTVLPLKFLRATARLTVVMFVPFASVLVRTGRHYTGTGTPQPPAR